MEILAIVCSAAGHKKSNKLKLELKPVFILLISKIVRKFCTVHSKLRWG
jgi:hypothetical protein